MKNLILILLLAICSSIFATSLGHKPGEIYFEAYSKDAQGKYTIPTLYRTRNYGATAVPLIKNFNIWIYADAKPGCFYKKTQGETLEFSSDTCQTWTYRAQDCGGLIETGRYPGVVFNGRRYSTDYGVTWKIKQFNGLPSNGTTSVGCNGYEKGEDWAYEINTYKTYRSTDYGNNFTYVATISPGLEANAMSAGWQPGEVCIANWGVVYLSSDYGHTFNYLFTAKQRFGGNFRGWARGESFFIKTERYPQFQITSQKITFYRLTNFQQNIDSVVCNYGDNAISSDEFQVTNCELNSYPNPFNNSTEVSYILPADNNVGLAVYNNKGELVRNLIKGKQNAGTHNINFDAAGLNSGVYYVRLKYNNNLKTHKILLVK